MKRLELNPEAIDDLRTVSRFSYRTWGRQRRDAYMAELVAAMNGLRIRDLGRRRDEIKEGLWSIRSGRHVILFRRDAETVRILRVLHERRDLMSPQIGGLHEESTQQFLR